MDSPHLPAPRVGYRPRQVGRLKDAGPHDPAPSERLPFPQDWGKGLGVEGHVLRPLWRLLLHIRFRLFQHHRYNRLVWERVAGRDLLVLPNVFNPKLFRTGAFLARALDERLIRPGANVLDMGTGSGIGAVFAAQWARRVVAVDINPAAVRCAQINVLLQHIESRVEVRQGDLFEPVEGAVFDVVLFNPPYFRGAPRDALDQAWRSTDMVERFAAGLSRHLAPDGYALVALSTDGEKSAFIDAFHAGGLTVSVCSRRNLINETLLLLRVQPSPPTPLPILGEGSTGSPSPNAGGRGVTSEARGR